MDAVKPPRVSRSPGRQRARATRLRITKAAAELFTERGYAGTTMADIAAGAGVAVQTVYFVFHTKTEVLDSAYSLAVMGEHDPVEPHDQAWYRQAAAEPDVKSAVRLLIEGVGEIVRRAAPLDFAVRTAAAGDPEAAALLARTEKLRLDGYRGMVALLERKCRLLEDVTEDRAADVLLFLASASAYRALVMERGWTHSDWIVWTSDAVIRQLFQEGC